MFSDTDFAHMQRALTLAACGMYTTAPNPRVGCVIVKDGDVIGEGFTQPAGQDHAEVQALKDARSRGYDVAGSTVYVTLEPCSHFGRTPPCANALIDARVAKVVAAMEDPNPQVSGRGLGMLRDAGIDVRCGLLANEAGELNIGFVSRMTRGRPWVRMKTAASLDGRTALPSGESQWITGDAARLDGTHNFQHVRGLYVADRLAADLREHVDLQGVDHLAAIDLRPSAALRLKPFPRDNLEGRGYLERPNALLLLFLRRRIDAARKILARR